MNFYQILKDFKMSNIYFRFNRFISYTKKWLKYYYKSKTKKELCIVCIVCRIVISVCLFVRLMKSGTPLDRFPLNMFNTKEILNRRRGR